MESASYLRPTCPLYPSPHWAQKKSAFVPIGVLASRIQSSGLSLMVDGSPLFFAVHPIQITDYSLSGWVLLCKISSPLEVLFVSSGNYPKNARTNFCLSSVKWARWRDQYRRRTLNDPGRCYPLSAPKWRMHLIVLTFLLRIAILFSKLGWSSGIGFILKQLSPGSVTYAS